MVMSSGTADLCKVRLQSIVHGINRLTRTECKLSLTRELFCASKGSWTSLCIRYDVSPHSSDSTLPSVYLLYL